MINILRSRVRVIFPRDDIGEDRQDIARRATASFARTHRFFLLPFCHPPDKAFDTIRPTVVVSRANQPEFNLRRDREDIERFHRETTDSSSLFFTSSLSRLFRLPPFRTILRFLWSSFYVRTRWTLWKMLGSLFPREIILRENSVNWPIAIDKNSCCRERSRD